MRVQRKRESLPKENILVLLVLLLLLSTFSGCIGQNSGRLILTPIKHTQEITNASAAVGWSINRNYRDAVSDAITMAKNKLGENQPVFAYVVFTSKPTVEENNETAEEIRSQLGPEVKMVGLTTKLGVMTNDGLHVGQNGSLAVLLVASRNITFGVGEVDLRNFTTPQEAGRTAIQNAIADAGSPQGAPDLVMFIGTTRRGEEMRILDGIAEVIGAETPVIGGNANDDKVTGLWTQITHKQSYRNGLILVAVYTDLKTGWGFETGYKLTDKRGNVTSSDGFLISEIDGQPALDVYDGWLDGELYKRLTAGEFDDENGNISFDKIKKFTLQNPIARVIRTEDGRTGHYTISPIPNSDDIKSKKLRVFAEIQQGWEIALYRGTWQTHMNRVETIPQDALDRAGLTPGEGMFCVMQFCNGLRSQIPAEEFTKIPAITDDILGGIPFIGAITGGEQGPLPEVGRNVNANLIECMIVVG
jgi:hypothetical protein